MLTIELPQQEFFNQEEQKFFTVEPVTLTLEHSLVSLSKWESIHEKPFLTKEEKTPEELFSYISCMSIGQKNPEGIIIRLNRDHLVAVNEYIQSSRSATTFGQLPERPGKSEIITSELVYYWMVAFSIPFEAETWHLNRLFALVRICNIKNSKEKGPKINKQEAAQERHKLNMERRAAAKSSG